MAHYREGTAAASEVLELVREEILRGNVQRELLLRDLLHEVPGVVGPTDFRVERLEEPAGGVRLVGETRRLHLSE